MINPKLLKPKVMKELSSGFKENNPQGVQVQGFMDAESYKKFLAVIANVKFKKSEVRDTHSFFEANHAALEFFNSKEFLYFASVVTGKKLTKAECTLKIFLAGSYTLLHDNPNDNPKRGIELYFDFTPGWKAEWGGATFFVTKEGEKLMIPPAPNTLVIAEARRSYVKYVNKLAWGEGRLVVSGTLKCQNFPSVYD